LQKKFSPSANLKLGLCGVLKCNFANRIMSSRLFDDVANSTIRSTAGKTTQPAMAIDDRAKDHWATPLKTIGRHINMLSFTVSLVLFV